VWLADFDTATGAITHLRKLTNLDLASTTPFASPDGNRSSLRAGYPECPAIQPNDGGVGYQCNTDRDEAAADSKVKAQIFTHLLYPPLEPLHRRQTEPLFSVLVENVNSRPDANESHDIPPFSLSDGGGFAFAPDSKELPSPKTSTRAGPSRPAPASSRWI